MPNAPNHIVNLNNAAHPSSWNETGSLLIHKAERHG